MKVYLAARYGRQAELRGYRKDLEDAGITVTSSWLDADAADDPLGVFEQRRVAAADYQDIEAADVLVAFTEEPGSPHSRGGRHVEFGLALEMGKFVVCVGPLENIFQTLADAEAPSWPVALALLAGLRHATLPEPLLDRILYQASEERAIDETADGEDAA